MPTWTLERLNTAADSAELRAALASCCAAGSWVTGIVTGRPHVDLEAIGARSDRITSTLDDAALAQALAGHPRIGERAAAGHNSAWSSEEQSGASIGADAVRAELATANLAYEQRFGHVYLVCATGKSAEELLAICRARLDNDPTVERAVVLDELAQINRLRLAKLLGTTSS